jgi:putative membrane protein
MVEELLTAADRERLAAAIAAAEAQTSGEIVAVVAREPRRPVTEPLLVSALLALVLPLLLWLPNLARDASIIYAAQLGLFAAAFAVLFWTPAGRWLLPPRLRRARAERLAREQFMALGLHRTREGTGVMLFVLPSEHHVQVLADDGINAKVPQGAWDAIVSDLVQAIRQDRAGDGFVAAIGACGALLAQHFPRRGDDRNELPDQLFQV